MRRSLTCLILGSAAAFLIAAPVSPAQEREQLGDGTFAGLHPDQRRLFAELIGRFSGLVGRQLQPEQVYTRMPESHRTTFEAVTHALLRTELTSESGDRMGTALDLVDYVDEILGQSPGQRGDRQFRLYVFLKPDAADKLFRSREFVRKGDNTVYHLGFPMNYRQSGGVPSVQISVSEDRRKADIDVDYRPAVFPKALYNGHLSSANSDIRAGLNYLVHDGRWQGLKAWWASLVAFFAGDRPPAQPLADIEIPENPPLTASAGFPKIADNFLKTWLVDGAPNVAAAYFSRESYGCYVDETKAETGMVRVRFMEAMRKANSALGKISSLDKVTLPVDDWDTRLKEADHPQKNCFRVFQVPEEVAGEILCDTSIAGVQIPRQRRGPIRGLFSRLAGRDTTKYWGLLFRLTTPEGDSPALFYVWRREGKYWKIVGLHFRGEDPGAVRPRATKEIAAATPRSPRRGTEKPPEGLAKSVMNLLDEWLVRGKPDRALGYFDPASFACVADLAPEAGPARSQHKQRQVLRRALVETSRTLGTPKSPADAVRGVAELPEDSKVIAHADEETVTLLMVSDQFGRPVVCGAEPPTRERLASAGPPQHGNYFISVFQFKVPGDPAYMWMVWVKVADNWKIRFWRIEVP